MIGDPKPAKRIVDGDAGRIKVALEGRCRCCGRTWGLNRMHLVPKGQGGDDVDDNIAPGCGSGTTGCHGALTAHTREWRVIASQLRASLTDAEVAYILQKKGQDWLDRTYPRREMLA